MRLDSVRELKQELLGDVLRPLTLRTRMRSLSVPAMSKERVPKVRRTIALGIARGRRENDFRLAVRLQRKEDIDPEIDRLRRIARKEIDVRFVGRITKRTKHRRSLRSRCLPEQFERRVRPLIIGLSVGHIDVTAGTLGAFVRQPRKATTLLLSNNHVLANENRAAKGDPIVQPGTIDGGRKPKDVIAKLLRFVAIKFRGRNFVDCAVAQLDAAMEFDATTICGMPALSGDAVAEPGLAVSKVGRTTGLRNGVITAIEVDNVVVSFDEGNVRFDNQIEIESASSDLFSDGGDSGSLIVTKLGRASSAVGLLFAGSDQGGNNDLGLTYANAIQAVFKALNVELL